ncbi:MAG: hypothetical protein PHD76_12710 [Methylacidiphilales bacterium]|nr:hypothetical protein [Candidatus Methylacidiphilales bacterium]
MRNVELMTPVALVLSLITLVYCLFALGDCHQPAVVTGPEIIVAISFIPMALLSFGLVVYGGLRVLGGERRSYYTAVSLLALPLLVVAGTRVVAGSHEENYGRDVSSWCSKADSLAAILLDYYHLHPDRFHVLGDSEEVTVDGFTEFCQSRPDFAALTIRYNSSQLLDCMGKPFHYYVDRDHNGQVGPIMRGQVFPPASVPERVGVMDSRTNCVGLAPRPKE